MTTRQHGPDTLPAEAIARFERDRAAFDEQLQQLGQTLPDDPQLSDDLRFVWVCSEFVAHSCVRDPAMFIELIAGGDLERAYGADDYHCALSDDLRDVGDETALKRCLRRRRQREMVRIAWRDLTGRADLDETLGELSALADACIDSALVALTAWHVAEFGTPVGLETQTPQRLVVLGMGKLGASELNFSSDVDLVFAFDEPGETRDGPRPVANEQFFTTLGRRLINALSESTVDGFVFRIDMRLRPYGDSGPLVMSFDALEDYYQSQGRDWERYAMVKARPVAGDLDKGRQLLDMLRPFVYRRYLDYGSFEALRDMKAMINREVKRRGLQDNIKLGPGGIREIEFIGQLFQLIRGGQERTLQQRGIQPVLTQLAELGHLPVDVTDTLLSAYVFLRRTENRLQAADDKQTHTLPQRDSDRLLLALAMGFDSYAGFKQQLDAHRRRVQDHFEQIFEAPRQVRDQMGPLSSLWLELNDEQTATRHLQENGFSDAAEALRRLRLLRDSHACRAMSNRGRERLNRVMPLLLEAVAANDHPDTTLARLLELIEAVARRSVYLALLVEHPAAISQLVTLCGASPWLSKFLVQHPILLDELLDPRTLYSPLERQALHDRLDRQLDAVPDNDLEQQLDSLRHFKQVQVLHVAAADLMETIPLMVVSDYLTEIAEVLLERILDLVARQLAPAAADHFLVIGYGKLGGIELGYGSDLDLVFLHDDDAPDINFIRLGQRIIHYLTARTAAGILYEVDMRLRPSGASGLLVSNIRAFDDYQHREAWTWEHQALIRARVIAGSHELAQRFQAIRNDVLGRQRDPDRLLDDIVTMRARMRRELSRAGDGEFDIKQGPGGMVDIEFLVQYCVLRWAHHYPELLQWTDNIRLLETLTGCGVLAGDDCRLLGDAYRAYRNDIHRLTLQDRPARVEVSRFTDYRGEVRRIWQQVTGEQLTS